MFGGEDLEGGEDIVEVWSDPEDEENRQGGADQHAADVASDGAQGQQKGAEHGAVGVGNHSEGEAEEVDFAAHGLEADRHGDESESPQDDANSRLADEFLLVRIFNAVLGVDKREGGLRKGGEGGVEAGNGGGKGPGEDQTGETGREDGGNPNRKNRVGVLRKLCGLDGGGRVLDVVDEQGSANEKHEDGDQKRNAAGDDGLRGVGGRAAAKHALGIELIGAEGGEILEGHGEQADPQRELHIGVGAEVEEPQFSCVSGRSEDFGEAAIDLVNHHAKRREAAADENEKLDDIRPDDSGHAAHEGPDDGKDSNDGDAPFERQAGDGPKNQRGNEQADALAKDRSQEEEPGGECAGAGSEAGLHVIVGAENPPLVENFYEPDANDEAGHDGANAPLQIGEIAVGGEDHPGHTDESDGADLGGNDGAGHGGPGE